MAERVKKPKSKVRKIIEWTLISLFGVVAAFAMVSTISGMIHKKEHYGYTIRFGIGTFVVKTESMEPEIKTGAMIITQAEDVTQFKSRLDNGENIDVTFFNCPVDASDIKLEHKEFGPSPTDPVYWPMTHRLREVHIRDNVEYGNGKYVFVVSGINEASKKYSPDQYQVFTEKEYFGTVKVANSAAGHLMDFISSPIGLIILLLIPAGYLIVTSSIDIFKAVKEEEANAEKKAAEEKEGGDRLNNLSEKDRQRLKDELLDEMIKSKKEEKK